MNTTGILSVVMIRGTDFADDQRALRQRKRILKRFISFARVGEPRCNHFRQLKAAFRNPGKSNIPVLSVQPEGVRLVPVRVKESELLTLRERKIRREAALRPGIDQQALSCADCSVRKRPRITAVRKSPALQDDFLFREVGEFKPVRKSLKKF